MELEPGRIKGVSDKYKMFSYIINSFVPFNRLRNRIDMKHLHFIIALPLFFFLVACYGTDSKTDTLGVKHSVEELTKNPSSKITHKDGWTIVSKMENGDRVYWFLAPDVDNVSSAIFKKIVYVRNKSELETETVSKCDAPKQTCDDFMKQFKNLSEKYR
jgi:hypothetical protein